MPEKSKDEEIAMMQDPENWPRWPVLPLTNGGLTGELAVLVDGYTTRVYHANMFQRITTDTKFTTYESYEAIYDDGWRVD